MRMAAQEEEHIHEFDERVEQVARAFSDAGPLDASRAKRLEQSIEELRAAETAVIADQRRLKAQRARADRDASHFRELFTEAHEAVIVTDASGFILEANRAAADMTRRSAQELRSLPVATLLAGDARAQVPSLLDRLQRERRLEDLPVRLKTTTGARDVVACLCALGSGAATAIAWHLRDAALAGGATSSAELERRLKESRAELEHATAARDEFLGLMSHELKTPIAVIAGNAEVLARREHALAPEQRTAALADIRGEASRLQRIVDNLLALARLERGQQIGREPVDLKQVIRGRLEHHHAEWPERRFEVEVASDVPLVEASPEYVGQALGNLLTNAEQHTPRDQPIAIQARRHEDGALVAVADRGPVITGDEIDRLVGRFVSGDGSSPYGVSAGVGLAVARRLVEEQRGRLWAERRDNEGMTFAVWLPAQERGSAA